MGFLSGLFGGKKEKQTGNERFLKNVGEAQISASKMFEGAHQAMLREANADQSGVIRGRAAGSVWQGLGGEMGTHRLSTGDTRRQGGYEGLAQQAVGTALRGGSSSALKLRDGVIHAGASSRLSNAQTSGVAARDEARTVAAEAAHKVKLANEWRQELIEAGTKLATAGISEYRDGLAAGRAPPPGASYDDQTQNNGLIYGLGFKRGFGG